MTDVTSGCGRSGHNEIRQNGNHISDREWKKYESEKNLLHKNMSKWMFHMLDTPLDS